jgi:hypothetical protein
MLRKVEINTRTCFTAVVKLQDLKGKDTDLEKFITPQYYPIRTMIENLSFSSTSDFPTATQLLF